MRMIFSLVTIFSLLFLSACASKVNVNEAQEKVMIVKELPTEKKCVSAGIIEVKDILESSAIEELKNMAHGLDGNYVVIKETNYKTTFVIHKAEAFKCN
ncbi:MAG: hypothetical protein A2381_14400 [Bdellovibrionales bacterium RIFOXYB1_FULL_37_110]|nr:MAG: hypothetical protein A2417_07170 [Bdellovibrionales bacterium RIFOXYC1_FULL_37_79]OFZ57532.1 MAG: hypothetical protein A2381_14400 [Bdellovibrionales bacterium RIFOXYB1_FULL_37_110]OFZ63003.1 MAG: hypothetical protein A2577_07680 [Bdellovibrionales bacterium RIFOXYD1_FULL_36_51]